jgi:hypothetical protein
MMLTIYWCSHTTRGEIKKIRERFGITSGTTINGESPADIADADLPLLRETEKRGYIQIRKNKPELSGLLKLHDHV